MTFPNSPALAELSLFRSPHRLIGQPATFGRVTKHDHTEITRQAESNSPDGGWEAIEFLRLAPIGPGFGATPRPDLFRP
jgi:hypothetical protein